MSNPDKYLEDVAVGDTWTGEPIEMHEADIIAFGKSFDPQPFHIDPDSAKAGPFGSLIASGWHVAAVVMRQFVDSKPYGSTPLLGMGVDELRWLHPVRPGDRLTVKREIISVKRSESKPDRGVIRNATTVTNQDGVVVLRFLTMAQMPARPNAAA